MLAIMRNKTKRYAIGKDTWFRVRGRTITIEQVQSYFERRPDLLVAPAAETHDPPTPSDVSYGTPLPMPASPFLQNHTEMVTTYITSQMNNNQTDSIMSTKAADNTEKIEWTYMREDTARCSTEDVRLIRWTLNDMLSLISPDSEIPRSPSAPPSLQVPERLFFTIQTYMYGCFEKGIWATDEKGYCSVVRYTQGEVIPDPVDFANNCNTALSLLTNGSIVEFRRTLSKAFEIVKDCVRIEHPGTVENFLDVFLYITQVGYTEIGEMIRRFISQLASELYGKHHPLVHVCLLFRMLENESLTISLAQLWRVLLGTFKKKLGVFHRSTIAGEIDFTRRVTKFSDPLEAETHLRRLLAHCEEAELFSESQTFEIITELGWNLIKQGRYVEAENFGLDIQCRIGEQDFYWQKVLCLELLAESQYRQSKRDLAENNQRLAIKMIVDEWGMSDACAIKNMVRLGTWLCEWGDVDEADELKWQIVEAVGTDESDEILEEFEESESS